MPQRPKQVLVFSAFFLLLFLSSNGWPASEDYQTSQKALSDSFRGVLDGMGSVGRGLWKMTTNSGKLLWHGTHHGVTQGAYEAKKADGWLQKNLW